MRLTGVVIGAVVLLAVIAGILFAFVLGRDDIAGSPSASASRPAATASATSPTSAPAEPSVVPSTSAVEATASPAPTSAPSIRPEVAVPDGLLPSGSMISVTGDGVRIREAPALDAAIIGRMVAGDLAYVEDDVFVGPVVADGYEWYRVGYVNGEDVWPWQDVAPGGYVSGWIAAGSDAEQFVQLAEVSCPTEPVTLEVLARDLTPWERLVCLSGAPVVIEGIVSCEGCGADEPTATPEWLADVRLHVAIAAPNQLYPFVRVAIPPGVEPPGDRDIVRATLHVNDPQSETCVVTPDPNGTGPARSSNPEAARIFCRERLVLDAFEVIGTEEGG